MAENSVVKIKWVTRILGIYNLASAVLGILFLSPLLYHEIQAGKTTKLFLTLLVVMVYIPFLVATKKLTEFKKWAYFVILLFYVAEIIHVPSFLSFQVSFFHYSLMITLRGLEVGVDLISLGIVTLLLLVGKEYMKLAERV